eukprot:Sspe_Gene.4637::Locus_1530_Transcript_1_1_Confidence_1.000_Length_4505::g.4637::m.4637
MVSAYRCHHRRDLQGGHAASPESRCQPGADPRPFCLGPPHEEGGGGGVQDLRRLAVLLRGGGSGGEGGVQGRGPNLPPVREEPVSPCEGCTKGSRDARGIKDPQEAGRCGRGHHGGREVWRAGPHGHGDVPSAMGHGDRGHLGDLPNPGPLCLDLPAPRAGQGSGERRGGPRSGVEGVRVVRGGLVCAVFVAVAMGQQYTWCTRLSNRIRAMLAATIHKKSLVLSTNGWQAMGGHGKIFNLLNTDCETIFQRAYNVTAQAMSYPAQIILAIAFLAYLLSWPVVVGTVVMLACFRYNYLLGLELMDCFVSRMVKSDARVKKQHEFLENIHAVKYFAWEEHFLEQINKERQEEIGSVKRLLVGLAKLLFASNLGPYTFQVSILVVAAAWDESMLTTTTIFQAIALTSILRTSFTTAPMLYSQYFTILSAFSRIQDFLMKDERRFRPFKGSDGEIHVKNTEFAWKRNRPVLRGVNLHVKRGELVMVVGRVGCGKSSLLEGLLGEMNMNHDGELSVGGGVAYCPQAPWVFNGTLKDNILWKRPDYEGRYKRILRAAELTEDLKTLPHGENTEIGEKGINLSGGQKARVSLARAVYADEDIYFLDDPLSAVDAFVAKKLFDNVICGQLKRKTRIMVTNQLQFLSKADRIFSVTKDGRLMEEDLAAGYHPPADPAQRTVLQQLLVEFQSKVASRAGILGDVSVSLPLPLRRWGLCCSPTRTSERGASPSPSRTAQVQGIPTPVER